MKSVVALLLEDAIALAGDKDTKEARTLRQQMLIIVTYHVMMRSLLSAFDAGMPPDRGAFIIRGVREWLDAVGDLDRSFLGM